MIVFAHLLNDHTGSPRVLKAVIDGQPGAENLLFVGSDGRGALETTKVLKRRYWYRHMQWRFATLLTYFLSQALLLRALTRAKDIPPNAVIYVNTLLPFAAALWGWKTRRTVIYHLHELSLSPPIFQNFLVAVAKKTATRLIYVSHAHAALLPIDPIRSTTIHNAVDPQLASAGAAHQYKHRHGGAFVVTMLASTRAYKGVGEFGALAEALQHRDDIVFQLVGDGGVTMPANVQQLPQIDNPARYYEESSLVLNLSRPDLCIETFGLTLLEAMTFGIPVIAPPVGGPAEIVEQSDGGFLIDSRETSALVEAVLRMADDEALCLRMSDAARLRAADFDTAKFQAAVASVIEATHD